MNPGLIQIDNPPLSPTFPGIIPEVIFAEEKVDCIQPESINSLIQPEADYPVNFLLDFRVCPVQLRLIFDKGVIIILIYFFHISPCRTAHTPLVPVIGRTTIHRVFPDIVRMLCGLP